MQPMVNIALRAARKAGELIVRAADDMENVKIDEKGTNDFVTNVDKKVEKEIIYHIQKAYPDHTIIAEESGTIIGKDAEVEWIIDPLDGTTNFIRGIPHVAVSIAVRMKGIIRHGVVYNPFMRDEFTASRGDGAMLNGRRIRVSGRTSKAGALFATGVPFSGRAWDNMDDFLGSTKDIVEGTAGLRRMGSAALDLAYVAAGRFDGYWEMHLQSWDIAAGVLLVKEAGGMVCDFKGGENYLETGHIIATTPKLLKPTLRSVAKHLGHIQ